MGIQGGKGSSGRRGRHDFHRIGIDPVPSGVDEGQQAGDIEPGAINGFEEVPFLSPRTRIRQARQQRQRRRRRRREQTETTTTPIPFSPLQFPSKGEFRLGGYIIEEVKDDYLICRGFDPNAKRPSGQHTPSAHRTVKVAKPALLLKTPWDGETQQLIVNGVLTDVTYVYSTTETGKRTASAAGETSEVQRITMDYLIDDTLIAVQIRKNSAVDGVDIYTEQDGRLSWVDLNFSGRCWATTEEAP